MLVSKVWHRNQTLAMLAKRVQTCLKDRHMKSKVSSWSMVALVLAVLLGLGPQINVGAAETSGDVNGETHQKKAWFGELHVHSANSFDSYFESVRAGPEEAYRFAIGKPVKVGAVTARIKRPLDFLAVTDHAMYLGVLPAFRKKGHPAAALPVAKKYQSGAKISFPEFWQMLFPKTEAERQIPMDILNQTVRETWADYAKLADKYYMPGTFTTLVGYEWTSAIKDQGLHRNIIFRTTQVPEKIFSTLDSKNPEDLWAWMESQRANGIDLLAIPHNSNQSNGLMFALRKWDGSPVDAAWAAMRGRNEPLVEVTQIKGTSETTPALSPSDEWAGFEIFDELMGSGGVRTKPQGSYVRRAFKDGLTLSQRQGFNPYKFGLIGSSDGHNAVSPSEESNYSGKLVGIDGTAEKRRTGGSGIARHNWMLSAAGLAGVWAANNTREDIYRALEHKEAFATSGPRIKIRLFAGWGFDQAMMNRVNWADIGYKKGVPMGGDLPKRPRGASAPTFALWAMRDPASGWLDRLQIIKGWTDPTGKAHEKIYDVACAGGAQADKKSHRCTETDTLPSVDLNTCEILRGGGNVALKTVWKDPDFNPEAHAFYYARVIENPTCRWSTWDAVRAGLPPLEGVPATLKERAWSSPVWYTPG